MENIIITQILDIIEKNLHNLGYKFNKKTNEFISEADENGVKNGFAFIIRKKSNYFIFETNIIKQHEKIAKLVSQVHSEILLEGISDSSDPFPSSTKGVIKKINSNKNIAVLHDPRNYQSSKSFECNLWANYVNDLNEIPNYQDQLLKLVDYGISWFEEYDTLHKIAEWNMSNGYGYMSALATWKYLGDTEQFKLACDIVRENALAPNQPIQFRKVFLNFVDKISCSNYS